MPPRVAVIGAGVAGPVLACLIKQRLGWETTVFEAAHAIKEVRPPPGQGALGSKLTAIRLTLIHLGTPGTLPASKASAPSVQQTTVDTACCDAEPQQQRRQAAQLQTGSPQ